MLDFFKRLCGCKTKGTMQEAGSEETKSMESPMTSDEMPEEQTSEMEMPQADTSTEGEEELNK